MGVWIAALRIDVRDGDDAFKRLTVWGDPLEIRLTVCAVGNQAGSDEVLRGVAVDSMPLEGAYDLTASDLRRGKTVPIVVGILSNLLVALPLNGVDACGNALPSWSAASGVVLSRKGSHSSLRIRCPCDSSLSAVRHDLGNEADRPNVIA